MVQLHIKKGDESQFLVDTTVQIPIDELLKEVVPVYNGRLKVNRICAGKLYFVGSDNSYVLKVFNNEEERTNM